MQTYDPSIYAVGECVQHRNVTFGLVAPLWEQARVCATHLAELGMSRYRGIAARHAAQGHRASSSTPPAIFTAASMRKTSCCAIRRASVYKRLVIRDNKLRGAVLFGDASAGPWYFEMMRRASDVASICATSCCSARHAGS